MKLFPGCIIYRDINNLEGRQMAEGTENQENKTNNETKRVLTFISGKEYKIKIEKADEFKSSLFWPIYQRAARNLVKIINEDKPNEENTFFKDSYNNIIAFTGERGTGKSSCMISFAQGIKDISMKKTKSETIFDESSKTGNSNKSINDTIKESCFEEIGVIDPSMFEEKDNILEIIIAKMFARFNERIERTDLKTDSQDKRNLLKAFQKVYENLKTIQKEKRERLDGEVIEALSNLASGSNLRDSIIELGEKYLDFMGRKKTKTFFLLVIDDFDLNIKHAGEMTEQIRKYLVIPGVVILLAVKLDQLSSIIEQTYREKFKTLLAENRMSPMEPQNMAYLYLEKLIPEDRRLYLPDIRKIENKDICIRLEGEPGSENPPEEPLEDTILKMIYDKTGLIFLKQDYDFHLLIPDNLRDLNSLYVMLYSLENVDISEPWKIGEQEKRAIKNNLRRFEDYFFNTWLKNSLSLTDQTIIEEFLSVDNRQKNKFIVSRLVKKYKFITFEEQIKIEASLGRTFISKSEIQTIMDKDNNPLNISLGDVLFCLKKVFLYDDSFITKKFVFAIKTIYSLIFYKLLFIEKVYEDVQLLLGGSVYNPEDIQLIRKNKEGKRRDYYDEIDYSKAIAHFEKKGPFKPKLEWIHYFLKYLGEKNTAYRKVRDLHYDNSTNLTIAGSAGKIKHATFDALAFVCFVYNPQRMLQRIYGEDRIEETYISYVVKKWRDKYRAVLPIYSIEFLERVLQPDLSIFKREARGYSEYFLNFLKNLRNSINNILESNNHVNDKIILDAYDQCPVIPKVKDTKIQRFSKEQAGLINELFNEGEFHTGDSNEPIEEESQENPNQDDVIVFLNESLKSLEKAPDQEGMKIRGIKYRVTRFVNSVRDRNISELQHTINEADALREKMDNLQDDDKDALLELFNKIISLFKGKVDELNG